MSCLSAPRDVFSCSRVLDPRSLHTRVEANRAHPPRPSRPQGHFSALSLTDVFRFMSNRHDPTTIAVLLGDPHSPMGSDQARTAAGGFHHMGGIDNPRSN